jgi:23S rRNA pseudouridine2605 synthase
VDTLGLRVDPHADEILFDGAKIRDRTDRICLLLNKPAGYLVTSSDPQGRPTVFDLLQDLDRRVVAVGRLDKDTEGVLLFTDDGELAHRLAHPKHEIVKGYAARISGSIEPQGIKKLLLGVRLEDGVARAMQARILDRSSQHSEIYLELITGKNRQVKRMCAAIGHPVIKLRRISFAGLSAEGLLTGQWRYLSGEEVDRLKSTSD